MDNPGGTADPDHEVADQYARARLARISRPNVAEVDLGIIRRNTAAIKRLAGTGTFMFGAVKRNGYGLGLPEVAQAMIAGGVDGFTLADPGDAVRIRAAGIKSPILLYAGVMPSPDTVDGLRELNLMSTITDADSARAFDAAVSISDPISVFVKVDVGLERLGVYPEDAGRLIRFVERLPGLKLEGVYTHLHGSADAAYLRWQLDRFGRFLTAAEEDGIEVPVRMAESSASLGLGWHGPTNAVDPGHLLYGILPPGRTDLPEGVQPALRSLKSVLVAVKDIRRAEYINEAPIALRERMRVGIIPVGRGDGLHRLTSGQVRIRGKLAPILGRMSLEHTRVDVTDIPGCALGDEVEIIDGNPIGRISYGEVAACNGLDAVGLLLEIRASINRKYIWSEDETDASRR